MNDRDLEDLMRRARPVPSPPSAFHQAGQALLEEIMSSPAEDTAPTGQEPATDVTAVPLRRSTPTRRRWLVAAAAAAVIVGLAIAVPMVLSEGDEQASTATELPQEPLRTDGNPDLSMAGDQWRPTSLSQSSTEGAQTFTNADGQELTIWWRPVRQYRGTLSQRRAAADVRSDLAIFGKHAELLEIDSHYEVLIPTGETFVWLRVDGVQTRENVLSVLGDLRVLEPEEWERALGEGFVNPGTSAAVGREMVRDVPLPSGFDTSALATDLSLDRYSFGTRVLVAVSCAWLEDYARARADHDEKGMAAVATALNGNQDWAVMRETKQRAIADDGIMAMLLPPVAAKVATGQDVLTDMATLGCDLTQR